MTRPTPETEQAKAEFEKARWMTGAIKPDGWEHARKLERERDEAREATAWQPIETAPKDGTRILLGRVGYPWVFAGLWNDAYKHWSTGIGAMAYFAEPTHWAPHPQPPEARSREGGGL